MARFLSFLFAILIVAATPAVSDIIIKRGNGGTLTIVTNDAPEAADGIPPAGAALEGTELHVLGVYEGNVRTAGQIHGPEVRIAVDRPGRKVILLVGSYEAVRWIVEATEETEVVRIVRFGYSTDRSEVVLNGMQSPFHDVLDGFRYAYAREGEAFRALVEKAPAAFGVERLASFRGAYRAPETGFFVGQVDDDPELLPDHLAAQVIDRDEVPVLLRPYLDGDLPEGSDRVKFTYEGFEMKGDGGETTVIAPSLDVPEISWPVAGVHDAARDRYYGVSFGGEGFLYQYDAAADTWSVLRSMEQIDAWGMIHDPVSGLLFVTAHNFHRPQLLIFDEESWAMRPVTFDPRRLPGYLDIGDRANGGPSALWPIAVSEGKILLGAGGPTYGRATARGTMAPLRTYLVDIATGEAKLAAYRDLPGR